MNPLVSIIMPAYNCEDYIGEAIKSVLAQTYQNWELIVADDCSKDNTKNIVKIFEQDDNRIKPIYLDTNGGKPSITKNRALEKVSGKYIAFLDSDDLWLPEKLELQVSLMEKTDKYDLCYTGGHWIDYKGKVIHSFLPQYNSENLFVKMLKKYEINNQSVMITTKALKSTIKEFNESITIGEDYNLYMHILNQFDGIAIKKYLIKYRIHNSAITKNKKRISDGVVVTLKELNLFLRYPLYSCITYIKAIRFKFMKKKWI